MGPGAVRVPDWPARFDHFLAARRERPFQWGDHDCCLFALDWIEEATGRRLAEVRGLYCDADGAAALLRARWGTGDLTALATLMLGPPLASPLLAGRGDLLAFRHGGNVWLGLCAGPVGVAPGKRGLVTLPLGRAVAAWRVG